MNNILLHITILEMLEAKFLEEKKFNLYALQFKESDGILILLNIMKLLMDGITVIIILISCL